MKLNYSKASKKGQTMRTAVFGGPGSGKTTFALEVASEMVKGDMSKVLVIDTENESAGLYSDKFEFMHQPWQGAYNPEILTGLLDQADRDESLEVVIIDSASPFWDGKGGLLEIVGETNGKSITKGGKNNTFAGWAKATPIHNDFVHQVLNMKKHLIVTLRAKNATSDDSNEITNQIGVKPVQRDNFLYEFNNALYIQPDHEVVVVKSRTEDVKNKKKFSGANSAKEYSAMVSDWLSDNNSYVSKQEAEHLKIMFDQVPDENGRRLSAKNEFADKWGTPDRILAEDFNKAVDDCEAIVSAHSEADPFDSQPNLDAGLAKLDEFIEETA